MSDVIKAAQDKVNKLVHDLRTQQETIDNQTKAIDDLKAAQRELHEANSRPRYVSEGDAALKKYMDGDRVLLKSGKNSDGDFVPGILDDAPVCDWQKELQGLVDQRGIVRMFTKRGQAPASDRAIARHIARAPEVVQRIFTDVAGDGAEWIPDYTLPIVESDLFSSRRVESLFATMPLPGKEFKLPYLSVGLRPYLKAIPTTDTPSQLDPSTMTTADIAITCASLAVRSVIDEDASEDSVVSAIEIIRSQLVGAIVDGTEDAIINGDTAGTQDDIQNWDIRGRWGGGAFASGRDHRESWMGLRRKAIASSADIDQNLAQTYAGFLDLRAALDAPQGMSGDLICITSPEYYTKMLQFTEVVGVDVFGPNATVLSGQLASLAGVPVIVSEFMGADMNASGVYDNVTTNLTGMLVLNRSRFKVGTLRTTTVELDKDISRGIYQSVATVRKVLFSIDPTAKKNCAYGYNLTP